MLAMTPLNKAEEAKVLYINIFKLIILILNQDILLMLLLIPLW